MSASPDWAAEGLPDWLAMEAELGYISFELQEMLRRVRGRSAMDVAVDLATGHEQAMVEEAKRLHDRADELRSLLSRQENP